MSQTNFVINLFVSKNAYYIFPKYDCPFIIQQCCTSFCFSYFKSYSKVILGYLGDSSVSKEHLEMKYEKFEV